jgi:FxsC-like protein
VSHIDPGRRGLGPHGNYFYLSYAQSLPLAGMAEADPDQWVRGFFDDLTEAVRQRASPQSGLGPGLFDKKLPIGSDWKASLTTALSLAEVFVPLYSPGYFARAWPALEWARFRGRLENAGIKKPLRRFAPVLWTPLPWGQEPPADLQEAMADAESEYAENGLRTMLRLQPYRPIYDRVIRRLAAHIVNLAEESPVGPSAVPDIDDVPPAFKAEAYGAVFAITVAAPKVSELPSELDRAGYGNSGVDWRPFPRDQELPLSSYAARIVEQMDFAAMVTSIEKAGDRLTSMPGVILIDPQIAGRPSGLAALRSFAQQLPVWVLPLVVLRSEPDSRSAELRDQVRGVLRELADVTDDDVGRRALRGVSSLAGFVDLMPVLAAEAERRYLRHGPVRRSTARVLRPRLAGEPSPERRTQAAPLDRATETEDD